MRAFVLPRYGGPEVAEFRDVPVPRPGPGEVRIAVRAAALNPVDFKIREGQLRPLLKLSLPIVLGSELAGVVDELGAGVTGFAVGDEVYTRVDKERLGAFAETACVDAALVARKPTTIDLTRAAAVPLAGLTALQALRDVLHVAPGQRVFLPGGAGGVGTFAIQLAKHFGAEVTTTASERGRPLVERLGADHVVDYTKTDFATVVRDQDAAFDLVGGDTLARAFRVLRRGGTLVSIAGMPDPALALELRRPGLAVLFLLASAGSRLRAWRHGVSYRYLFMHPSGPDLAFLAGLVDDGLEVVIDRVFPFSEIAQAFAYLEAGHAKGKVVVTIGGG